MPTPRPDSAPAPGADQTVRLGAGPGGVEETVRLGAAAPGGVEETVRLGAAPAAVEETVRLGAAAPGGVEETVRLGAAPAAVEETVRLGAAAPGGVEETVRLGAAAPGAAAPAPAGPDAEATVRLHDGEDVGATFLDPRAWGGAAPVTGETVTHLDTTPVGETVTRIDATPAGETVTRADTPAHGSAAAPAPPLPVPADGPTSADTPAPADPGATPPPGPSPAAEAPQAEPPLAPGELRRFGPGVPPQAAAVWHGAAVPGAQQPRRPRRVGRWLVGAAVLLAVLAFLYWRFATPALAVTGVGVTTDPAGPACGGTAVVTAAVETNGGAGTIRYRWLRSDGTTSDEIVQDVRSGAHHTDLVLRWSFEGHGDVQATATLEILSPATRTAATTFPYHCS
ncbi:hypothetical protein [Kitasatospora sp. NPDC047058]|uniref:hypothetical protein n=1 Tax=Kitasatospora sp. NPDC047058 TaxID=3155620 RepID=UPI0033E6887C